MKHRKTKILFLVILLVLLGAVIWQVFLPPARSVWREPVPNAKGECPRGYVNYGIPLGCITKAENDRCKKEACPICLSSLTQINTPNGKQVVTTLKKGELVWSIDGNGQKIAVPIIKTTKRKVPQATMLLNIVLQDGRTLYISPNHPTADGKLFSTLKKSDALDGSIIVSIVSKNYSDGYTYDILPDSLTGQYWANDVLVGSTLRFR